MILVSIIHINLHVLNVYVLCSVLKIKYRPDDVLNWRKIILILDLPITKLGVLIQITQLNMLRHAPLPAVVCRPGKQVRLA